MKRIGKNETTEMAPVKKCFVGLETALYLLFLALDAFSTGGDGVKYLAIVVCLLAAVWSARHGGSRLMAWAMAFTLAADTFLLLLDRASSGSAWCRGCSWPASGGPAAAPCGRCGRDWCRRRGCC